MTRTIHWYRRYTDDPEVDVRAMCLEDILAYEERQAGGRSGSEPEARRNATDVRAAGRPRRPVSHTSGVL